MVLTRSCSKTCCSSLILIYRAFLNPSQFCFLLTFLTISPGAKIASCQIRNTDSDNAVTCLERNRQCSSHDLGFVDVVVFIGERYTVQFLVRPHTVCRFKDQDRGRFSRLRRRWRTRLFVRLQCVSMLWCVLSFSSNTPEEKTALKLFSPYIPWGTQENRAILLWKVGCHSVSIS